MKSEGWIFIYLFNIRLHRLKIRHLIEIDVIYIKLKFNRREFMTQSNFDTKAIGSSLSHKNKLQEYN